MKSRTVRQLPADGAESVLAAPRDAWKTADAGLGITDDHWTTAVKHLTATLDKLKVPAKEKGEVLATITALKGTIVVK